LTKIVGALRAKLVQDFLVTNCRELIDKDKCPPNSNPLDYHIWGAMLEHYKIFHPKPKNIEELKNVLQVIWDQLPQVSINKASVSFTSDVARVGITRGGNRLAPTPDLFDLLKLKNF